MIISDGRSRFVTKNPNFHSVIMIQLGFPLISLHLFIEDFSKLNEAESGDKFLKNQQKWLKIPEKKIYLYSTRKRLLDYRVYYLKTKPIYNAFFNILVSTIYTSTFILTRNESTK